MTTRYKPKDHIHELIVAPRSESDLDQREITVQSYQTKIPFDYRAINAGLDGAWLTPLIRLGVFSRIPTSGQDAVNVVLGLQDELTVRTYDHDNRRPLWYSWQNTIVETMKVHYHRDHDGFLRLTTAGGGRRITDERLHDFNRTFLRVPEQVVTKRQFELEKLRELCFSQFVDALYMIKFMGPSANEYRSIEHASFQSRKHIDPTAERLEEIRTDAKVRIESFDSDVTVKTDELLGAIHVRFLIRGLSGSLRLRFPKIPFKDQQRTPHEQISSFYRLIEATVSSIIRDEYYAKQPRSLDDLTTDVGYLSADFVNLAPYQKILANPEARRVFILGIDFSQDWPKWSPHLQALDEILVDPIIEDVTRNLGELVRYDPIKTARLLIECQVDPKKHRVGALVARVLANNLQTVTAELRAKVEDAVLAWAIEHEEDSWDVDADTDEISNLNIKWRADEIAFDAMPRILWKLVRVFHSRIMKSNINIDPLLRKFNWCIAASRELPKCHSNSAAALQLVAAKQVPYSVAEASRVLKAPIADFRALDDAVFAQFGLPLWPLLAATRRDQKITLSNDGIGAALAVKLTPANNTDAGSEESAAFDLVAGASISIPATESARAVEVLFEKFGQTRRVTLPIVVEVPATAFVETIRTIPQVINKKRREALKAYREKIDPKNTVVGASPALLELFEEIHHANVSDNLPPVLLLGETGVGKTHIAELIHKASSRAAEAFIALNSTGGGDVNIQRGEWLGYGKNHGIRDIEKKGQPGHLMRSYGGTLFVDEFGSMSQEMQAIFLSVLDKRSVQKVGGESFVPDVRCIFATNVDLENNKGPVIRKDLLQRIPVKIIIPPLRKRRGDILLLTRHFSDEQKISDPCSIALLRYSWPGNIRELQNKVAAAKGRNKIEKKASELCIDQFEFPADLVAEIQKLDKESCHRELWVLANEIVRDEGFERGMGRQRRAGEILDVTETHASRIYRELGL